MRKSTRWRLPVVGGGGRQVVSQAGGVLLVRAARTAGVGPRVVEGAGSVAGSGCPARSGEGRVGLGGRVGVGW